MRTISDSIIDTLIANSSGKVDIMSKNSVILLKVPFFGMVSTLQLELAIGTSMVLSDIVIIVYHKVSEWSKSVGTFISPVNLCKYCEKWGTWSVSKFGTKFTT